MDRKVTKRELIDYEQFGCYQHCTIDQYFKNIVDHYKDRIALVDGIHRYTYSELDIEIQKCVMYCLKNGISQGDNVLIQLPNSDSFIIFCFALFRIGAVPVAALPAHRKNEIEGIIEATHPVAYILKEIYQGFNYYKFAQDIRKHTAFKFNIISDNSYKDTSYDGEEIINTRDYKDIAYLMLSSGTTGKPKIVPVSHAMLMSMSLEATKKLRIDQNSVYLDILPISHKFAFSEPGILGTLLNGGKVVICKFMSWDEAFPLIEDEKVTFTAVVPSLVKILNEMFEITESYDLTSLKFIQIGGAAIEYNSVKLLNKIFDCAVVPFYGATEGAVTCTSLDDTLEVMGNTCGKPLALYDEIVIVDEKGYEVKEGDVGEVWVRGPYTITSYFDKKDNEGRFTSNYFDKMGDLARYREDGNIQIVGRKSEMINRAGEKIVPAEIEFILKENSKIKDAAVIAVPDEMLGERICAFIVANSYMSVKDIGSHMIQKGIALYKIPDQIIFVEQLPLTANYKVDKKKLLCMVLNTE